MSIFSTVRVVICIVGTGISLVQKSSCGVLEQIPENVPVGIAHPRNLEYDVFQARRFERARIRNPEGLDRVFMAIHRGACLPTAAQTAIAVSGACAGTYLYCVGKAYKDGATFQDAWVVGGVDFAYNKLPVVKDVAVATVSSFSMENLVRASNMTAEDGREGEVVVFALTTFASRVIRPTEDRPKRVPRTRSKRFSILREHDGNFYKSLVAQRFFEYD